MVLGKEEDREGRGIKVGGGRGKGRGGWKRKGGEVWQKVESLRAPMMAKDGPASAKYNAVP